jgi:hypothetical protein
MEGAKLLKAELEKRGGYEICYISHADLSSVLKAAVFFTKKAYQLATAKYVFMNDNFMPLGYLNFRKEAVIVQLWHAEGAFKKFGLHIPNCMFGSSPDKSTPMEFFWDYHTWLEEKLCDEVTHKLLMSDGFSADSLKLLEICREKNIPVNYCRMLHGIPDPADYAGKITAIGVDAFNIYEAGTVWSGNDNGEFTENKPEQAASLWRIPGI